MTENASQYFALFPSMSFIVFALIHLLFWYIQKNQTCLLWLSVSSFTLGLAFLLQIILTPATLAKWSFLLGLLYLISPMTMSYALITRFHYKRTWKLLLGVVAIGYSIFLYFAYIQPVFNLRVMIINLTIVFIYIFTLARIRKYQAQHLFDRLLVLTVLLTIVILLLRTLFIVQHISAPLAIVGNVATSVFWFTTQLIPLILSIIFSVLFIACGMQDAMNEVMVERNRDPLTGILNRRAFIESTQKLEQRSVTSVAVFICDVDNFKNMNDTYGHSKGDEVLVMIATVFTQYLRSNDIFARFGGEEFVGVLNVSTLEEAYGILDRIRPQLKNAIASLPITMSFGLTLLRHNEAYGEAIKRADQLLYEAKNNGKDKIVTDSELSS